MTRRSRRIHDKSTGSKEEEEGRGVQSDVQTGGKELSCLKEDVIDSKRGGSGRKIDPVELLEP